MELLGIFLVLTIQCVCAEDYYTVTITKIGGTGDGDCNNNPIATTVYDELPTDLVESLNNTLTGLKKCSGDNLPRDCGDIQNQGNTSTGVYTIYPKYGGGGVDVRCDMDGGWTIIQRRVSDSDFYKTWEEYKAGFGDANGNYWLGNEAIHLLVSQDTYKLRVEMTDQNDATAYAEYQTFTIGDECSNYTLTLGPYTGNAGDSLNYHNGYMFTTKDRDNDLREPGNCAQDYTGAWWYRGCHKSNLNGKYGDNTFGKGPNWEAWKGHSYALKTTEMKIRRV